MTCQINKARPVPTGQWLTAAPRHPLNFLADQLFNETRQMRVKPAPQHALEQVLGHVLDGAFAQGPRHQGIGQAG